MALMNWDQSLDIHVGPMNDQHKEILRLINLISDQTAAKVGADTVKRTLDELAQFTVKHFAEEERYLESIKYPELDVHKQVHKNMLSRFQTHIDEFQKTQIVSEDFFRFLKSWLTAHIRHTDMKYGEFSKKVKKAA